MKNINTYINEKLHITTNSHLHRYTYQPHTKDELREIIIQRIKEDGPDCDLNDIDVSKIDDMSNLFNADFNEIFNNFNGDISKWNVSNVKNMAWMFCGCKKFNCDLSRWDVSNVADMTQMFIECENFRQNLDDWDVSNVSTDNMWGAFRECPTKPKWYDKDKCE